jgi:hypothetical protein
MKLPKRIGRLQMIAIGVFGITFENKFLGLIDEIIPIHAIINNIQCNTNPPKKMNRLIKSLLNKYRKTSYQIWLRIRELDKTIGSFFNQCKLKE